MGQYTNYQRKSFRRRATPCACQKVHSDYWRDSFDYRREYFRKHPGLMGCIWFCSQCGKPLCGKDNVQVDHILPPSRFAHKKYKGSQVVSNNSLLARFLNNSFNTIAICSQCNQKKADKIGIETVKGFAAKTGETTVSIGRRILHIGIYGICKGLWLGIKGVVFPLQANKPFPVRFLFLVLYVGIILFLFCRR